MRADSSSTRTGSSGWVIFAVVVVALVALVAYSEYDGYKNAHLQQDYEAQIQTIEQDIAGGKCAEALEQYDISKALRDEITAKGLYYSIYTHARQAHAMKIAECFDRAGDAKSGAAFLDREKEDDPDYYRRAAVVYDDAGETEKAAASRKAAEKFQ